jgi:hypothetical protein
LKIHVADSLHDRAGELDVGRQVLDVKDWGHQAATSRYLWLYLIILPSGTRR